MEAAGLAPLGFVSSDYALLIWGLERAPDPAALLAPEGLRDGLETPELVAAAQIMAAAGIDAV